MWNYHVSVYSGANLALSRFRLPLISFNLIWIGLSKGLDHTTWRCKIKESNLQKNVTSWPLAKQPNCFVFSPLWHPLKWKGWVGPSLQDLGGLIALSSRLWHLSKWKGWVGLGPTFANCFLQSLLTHVMSFFIAFL